MTTHLHNTLCCIGNLLPTNFTVMMIFAVYSIVDENLGRILFYISFVECEKMVLRKISPNCISSNQQNNIQVWMKLCPSKAKVGVL